MPSLGADMEHGKVVEWLVKPGDYIHKGDVVAAVDTDKTVMDIESFQEGVLAEFLVDIGDTVEVGTPIARLTATPAAVPPPVKAPSPEPSQAHVPPPVRHLAHTLGIDVGRISGSGPGGEVTRADVERAAAASLAPAAPGKPAVPEKTAPEEAVAPEAPARAEARRVRSSRCFGLGLIRLGSKYGSGGASFQ